MDDDLLSLFLENHPEETRTLLETGLPDGLSFLEALEALVKRNHEKKLDQESERDYNDAMTLDKLLFDMRILKDELLKYPLELTASDIKLIRLHKLAGLTDSEKKAFEGLQEKARMVDLYESLQSFSGSPADFCEKARLYLAYRTK